MQTLLCVPCCSPDCATKISPDMETTRTMLFGMVDCLHLKEGDIWNPDKETIDRYVRTLDQNSLLHLPMVIEGNFLLMVKHENATYILCDRFCKHRIFYKISTDQISFFDHLLEEDCAYTLDSQAVKTFLVYRYVPTGQALFAGIQQLMPGEILKIDQKTGVVNHLFENTFPLSTPEPFDLIEAEKKYHVLLRQALEKRISLVPPTEKIFLPLSGGFDSRVILATVLDIIPSNRLIAFTYGQPDTYDYEIGRKVARDIGVNHIQFPLDFHDYAEEKLLDNCIDTEGQISYALEAPLRVYKEIRELGQTILSGNAGGGIMGYLYMPEFDNSRSTEEIFFKDILCKHPALMNMMHDQEMIEKSFYFDQTPKASINMYERWMFNNHITKYTHYCNYKMRSQFNYISPYLDHQVCDFALSLPSNYRRLCKFYFQFIKDYYPKLANEPFTIFRGAALNSNRFTKYMTYQYDHARQILTGHYKRANKLDFARYRKELVNYPSLQTFLSQLLEPTLVKTYFSAHPHDQMMHTIRSLQVLCEHFNITIQ